MTRFTEIVRAVNSLSTEIQEIILFYIGDAILYFDFFEKPGGYFKALIISQGGPGFVLEEAIRSGHKPLLRWLLDTVSYPIDYLLTSAVCYGDLGMVSYIISLVGEDYKEHDTPAKLLCILKGKLHLLEYLFQENPTFRERVRRAECIHNCLLIGISKSSKIHSWYLQNSLILPQISKEDRIAAYLQNDNVAGAIELIGNQRPTILLKALTVAPSGSEETYRRLILKYIDEADILTLIARACARLGYVDTLEILLNEPYSVHVEYDFFVGIPNLAVVEVLHRHASQRNSISSLYEHGRIQKVKPRLTAYQTSKCYLKLLKTFTESNESIYQQCNPRWGGQQSEDVLIFLVDLANVTSSARLLKRYVVYGIECGHLRLLKMLVPMLTERDLRSITQGIAEEDLHGLALGYPTEYPNIYRTYRPQVVEYLTEIGITQPTYLDPLIDRFDLKFIQNLVEKGLARDKNNGDRTEWSWRTKRSLTDSILLVIGKNPYHPHWSEKGYQMELIRSTQDVFPYHEHYFTLESPHTRSLSFSTCDKFSCAFVRSCEFFLPFLRSCHFTWSKYPNVVISDVESAVRATNMRLLLPLQCRDV